MDIDPALIERLPPDKRQLFYELQAAKSELLEANPLEGLHMCSPPCGAPGCQDREKQREFMASMVRITAAFAGNRFGKTCANVTWAIIQHTPDDMLPERLKPFKRPRPARLKGQPVAGRYLCPSQRSIETIVLPEMRKWMPKSLLRGGNWSKGYSAQHNIIYFEDGGRLEMFTYEQDPAVMVGASLDYVIYDEPPPEGHYHENLIRTTDRAGCHRFGMTPVNMKGGGIG
jgi:phage terminase large subunit-like protein